MLLALYDGVIGKVEAARAALVKRDVKEAKKLLGRARLMVGGLVSAVDPGRGEMATRFLSLYEFVHRSLGVGDLPRVDASLKGLRTLREGLEGIRPEAAEL
jgi:flagellin-specific chaperone FliS